MNSIVSITKWLNSGSSPIALRNNESFSVPFISRIGKTPDLAFFSYSSTFHYKKSNTGVFIGNLYLFNPVDPRIYERIELQKKGIPGGKRIFPDIPDDTPPELRYSQILMLSDLLLKGTQKMSNVAEQYAALFNAQVPTSMDAFYLEYGKEFFTWINSMIQTGGDV